MGRFKDAMNVLKCNEISSIVKPDYIAGANVGNHKLSNNRYLYNCGYIPKRLEFSGYGQEGRIFKREVYGETIYYLCVMNCAIDWDDWCTGDALIPIVLNEVNNCVDIVSTCNFDELQKIVPCGEKVFPIALSIDCTNLTPTEMIVPENEMKEFKERCWFRDVAFDYNENETSVHSFVLDHRIPYAEHHPGFLSMSYYCTEIPEELRYSNMLKRFKEGNSDSLNETGRRRMS